MSLSKVREVEPYPCPSIHRPHEYWYSGHMNIDTPATWILIQRPHEYWYTGHMNIDTPATLILIHRPHEYWYTGHMNSVFNLIPFMNIDILWLAFSVFMLNFLWLLYYIILFHFQANSHVPLRINKTVILFIFQLR